MKPVMQTVTGPAGNCMSACLASILELPIEAVPNFCEAGPDDSDYWNACRAWLRQFGLGIITLSFTSPAQWQHLRLSGYHIVSGPSPRIEGMHHATVWHKGALAHDPHPEGGGIVAPEDMCMLYLVDPARLQPRAEDIARALVGALAPDAKQTACGWCNGRGSYGIPGQHCHWCDGTGKRPVVNLNSTDGVREDGK